MAQTFQCPNCGGPLNYEGRSLTVSCPFCGSTVVVPESLRPPEPAPADEVIIITTFDESPSPQPAPSKPWPGWLVGLLITGLILWVAFFVTLGPDGTFLGAVWPPTPIPTPSPTSTPIPFARLTFSFGEEGEAPGYFADPRTLTVDAQGRFFVGDYLPGRIQAFAPDGTFLWQQTLPNKTDSVGGLTADLQGRLYVIVGRDIYVYQADTGQLLAQWATPPDHIGWYRAIATTPQNEVVAVQERELVKLDAQGQVLLHLGGLSQDFLPAVGVSDEIDVTDMIVDGAGGIYVSTTGNTILKLDEQGKLLGLINGSSQEEGSYATAIAVDGQGNLAWGYDSEVIITNPQGRYEGEFKTDSTDDIEFNLKGQLVSLDRTPPHLKVYTIEP